MAWLFLLQTVAATPMPATSPIVHQTLERQPALLTLVFLGGLGVMVLLLLLSFLRNRNRPSALAAVAPEDLPVEVRRKLGATSTNRGLKALRALFLLMALGIFGFHVYWARFAEETNQQFQDLSNRDQRTRRIDAAILNGWLLDRTGRLDKALAFYKKQADGDIARTYPYEYEFSHLFGTNFGAPGLERALFRIQSNEAPEALELVQGNYKPPVANKDVRLTLDIELQQEAARQLKDKKGAVIVLNPQTGEVLALYSNPSYSIKAAQNRDNWLQLDGNKRESPLVNRALNEYYVPGSSFKTMLLIAAFRHGLQDTKFTPTAGYTPPGGGKVIVDDSGGCDFCGQSIGIADAFKVSSNKYFANLALVLKQDRLKETAKLLGIGAYDTYAGQYGGRREPELWNSGSEQLRQAIAPTEAWLNISPKMTQYELALEGFGQGGASQMTPLQMALIAAAAGNVQGKLMKLKIEYDRPPEAFSQVLTPDQAAQVRAIMGLVAQPGGTGARAMAPVTAVGITSGGKTGTAEKQIPVYDAKTGLPKKVHKYERDNKGNIIREYDETVLEDRPRSDAWYLAIAPLDRPVLAVVALVEGPGPGISNYGGVNAAPIVAQMVLKARQLGYFGGPRIETNPASDKNPAPAKPRPKKRR